MVAKFRKGDKVIVISGSDKGKTGDIIQVVNGRNSKEPVKFVVSGVAIRTKHKKRTKDSAGAIVKQESPIHRSNISHVYNNKPSKIGVRINSNNKRIRFYKKNVDAEVQ